ncbi:hypothetical protein [Bacillus sp. FJAT-52991]|uniref:Uncharacterized protein n=1 Tax=Bacillus kandeliae TaxID=3129297 RepID=A0ABZ2N2V9_9BACI
MENLEEHIKKYWFPDHVADYQDHSDLKVLDWEKPGTGMYYCRYVFDGNKMYVSGDIGEAVFWFTEKADLFNQCKYNLEYFEEKLRAYNGERRNFEADVAIKRMREWLNDLKVDEIEYDHDEMRILFEETRNCDSKREWEEIIHSHHDFIQNLEYDYWEWMYEAGDEVPMRIKGYLVGLKMAAEQLKSKASIA